MPIPVLIALGAWVVGAVIDKSGQAYNNHKLGKAQDLLKDAEKYVAAKEAEFTKKRRAYIERMHSYAQLIYAAFDRNRVGPSLDVAAELPKELKEFWADMLSSANSLKPTSADREGLPDSMSVQLSNGVKSAMMLSRYTGSSIGAGSNVTAAAGAFAAFNGANKVVSAQRAFGKACAGSQELKLAADRKLASIQTLYDDLGMRWDGTVIPFLGRAMQEPHLQTVLLHMAADLTATVDSLMKEFPSE